MENQLPLMPSRVISMQVFIVEVFFSVCLGEEKEYWRDLIFADFRYLHVHKPEVFLRSSNKSKVADCPAANKTCASGNETTWIRSLHRWEMLSTRGPSKRNESSDMLKCG